MTEYAFNYNDLDRSTDEIRLISLEPSNDSSAPVECNIIHAKLYDKPKYEALSYMWGSVTDNRPISVSGKEFQVGGNLYCALLQLRLKGESRLLWIDAICINQGNIIERSHQVSHMSSIYAQAKQVVISLGPATESSYVAIKLLDDVAYESVDPYDPELRLQWQAVFDLCQLEYWGRLWIIQEVVVASEITIYCGQAIFSWSIFDLVCERLVALQNFHPPDRPNYSKYFHKDSVPSKLSQRRLDSQLGTKHIPLVDLLSNFERASCKDYRDRIYGLRSLSMQCCQDEIMVDYSKPVTEIYNSVFKHYIDSHRPDYFSSSVTYMFIRYRHHVACGESMKHSSDSTSVVVYTAPNIGYGAKLVWNSEGDARSVYLKTLWQHLCYPPAIDDPSLVEAWSRMDDLRVRRCVDDIHHIVKLHPGRYLPVSETSLFLTDDGMFGFAPKHIMPGDIISRQYRGGASSVYTSSAEIRILRRITPDTFRIMTAVKIQPDWPDWTPQVPKKINKRLQGLLILVSK